jgi:signal transduction histidine kinase
MADGNYAYVHDRGHIIYGKDKLPSRIIGATQDITPRKTMEIKLLEAERKLAHERLTHQKKLTLEVLVAKENERSKLAIELQDNLNQILSAAKLYIVMAKTGERNREKLLEKSSGYIIKVIDEIRMISKTLTTPSLVIGLIDSIKTLIDDFAFNHSMKIKFHQTDFKEDDLDIKLKLTIFRLIKEQLNNIVKQATATSATIDLIKRGRKIILNISDNGDGADFLEEKNGLGKMNIKSEVDLFHGNFVIVSKPGEGYELQVVLPVKRRA